MHPINQLFEEIYRNYWGISPAADRPERRRLAKPASAAASCWSGPNAGRTDAQSGRASGARAQQGGTGNRQPAGDEQGAADRRRHRKQP